MRVDVRHKSEVECVLFECLFVRLTTTCYFVRFAFTAKLEWAQSLHEPNDFHDDFFFECDRRNVWTAFLSQRFHNRIILRIRKFLSTMKSGKSQNYSWIIINDFGSSRYKSKNSVKLINSKWLQHSPFRNSIINSSLQLVHYN